MAWKKRGWQLYGVDVNGADGWSWGFDTPYGYGYYEFYSVAADGAGNSEAGPGDIADSQCRVYRDFVRVAVILAEPNDVENFRPIEEMISTAEIVPRYFDEVSYGALAIAPLELITDDGGWFRLSQGWRHYGTKEWWQFWLHDRTKEFGEEAIRVAGIQRGIHDIVIVVFAGPSEQWSDLDGNFQPVGDRMLEAYWGGSEATPHLITVSEFSNPVYNWLREDLTWAHEIGHALDLPDLYPTSGSWGNANNWDLMGTRDMVHLSSWSKERLGWLEYQDIGVGWSDWIEVLPRLNYSGKAYRYWFESNEFFLLEVRNPSSNYSMHDKWIPGSGLVNYDVWYQEPSWWSGPDVNVEAHGLVDMIIDIPEAVVIKVVDQYEGTDIFKLKISVEEFGVNNMKGAVWRPVALPALLNSPWLSPPVFPIDNLVDYDLHAYTPDGRHVGMNYLTNTYEIEISGAIAFGDRLNREWIFVPYNIEVYFTVSSRDVAAFLENNPGLLENENAVYEFRIVYFDENGVRYRSDALVQEIPSGVEITHPFTITQNPDGTYSVVVEGGTNLLSIETWHVVIDNIPDNLFINQPQNRKQMLENKFGVVFNMMEENEYSGPLWNH